MWKYPTVGIMETPVPYVSPFIRELAVVPYFKVSMNVGYFD